MRLTRPSAFAARALAGYGTSVAMALLSFGNVLVVARVLGPTGRGDVAFLTTVAMLTSHFAALGVQAANANLGGAEPEHRGALATNSLLFSLGLGGLAIGAVSLLIALAPAVGAGSETTTRLLALTSIPAVILGIYLALLAQAAYDFAVVFAAGLTTPFVNAAANVVMAITDTLTVRRAVAAWVVGQILSTLLLVWHIAVRGGGFGRPSTRLARRTLGFGLKAHVGVVLSFGNYRIDQWIVGAVAGARELGLYSVAVAWSEGLFFLPKALAAAQRPDLVRASPETAFEQARKAHRVGQLATLVLAAGVIVLAGPLCVGVFGSDFRGSVDDLRVLALGGFGIVALKQLGDALTSQRMPGLESLAVGVAFIATIALDAALIPPFGGLGAAIASTAAYSTGGLAVAVIFWRKLGSPGQASRARGAEDVRPVLPDQPVG